MSRDEKKVSEQFGLHEQAPTLRKENPEQLMEQKR
jgi:hypothetical protein